MAFAYFFFFFLRIFESHISNIPILDIHQSYKLVISAGYLINIKFHKCVFSYFQYRLFIKPGIQERGTECEECGERGECSLGFRGIPWKIPGNVIILTFRGMFKKIPGNVQTDSGECSKRFRGMFQKIPGNVQEDSGECSKRFRGMLKKIPGNVPEDSGECSRRIKGDCLTICHMYLPCLPSE